MIKTLRKRHLQIWTAMAVLLPLGIIGALLVVPGGHTEKLLQIPSANLLPVLIKTIEKENYTINLRSNKEGTQKQLEWINKKPLTSPSALVYQKAPAKEISHAGEGGDLIGRIQSTGKYGFTISNDPSKTQFLLYDFIHQKLIDTINF